MTIDVHPLDIGLWGRIIPVAFETACDWKLPLKEIRPTPTPGDYNRTRHEVNGCCFVRQGIVHLVLRFKHPQTGQWMPGARPEADVWKTLAHELAHLEETRHSPRFYALMNTLEQDIKDRRKV